MRVRFQIFECGPFTTWETLCEQAAEFASTLSPELLINISHSEDHDNGVVTVWYWE